ncbi:2-C-methyl-D-erythritol 2,4-cyclodiphosphate synthase [Petrotoga sp. 9PWA.NaAc.5.4]|uniref:2-C-methyl-D-erythritol 2,4-cyclodiphosphate synthase n=1 Tax=Petrotoga sp. 9PWA.NaAc.5.4 TaxID=1434328 RepID=UPI000CB1BDC0|nr:2-C-methyl-D-erythritol 2,4-cyclodiphosphate synthase [Petrotoga sp. 9PWA.NaAc.5.4]PNR96679.1 2-C-methyl-D-erythritol 2,4-cyclodiphosphate synthase [Petrotoga sp. 9PWA.NaAc.5.4]
MLKIGFGYDIHALVKNRKLIIGGVEVEHPLKLGLSGHSDADVFFHALIDAILGMCGVGSIGDFFPETKEYKDANSAFLLEKILNLINNEYSFTINNIDSTIISKSIAISPISYQIKRNVARILKIEENQINIKGKSGNGLGSAGTDEGIEVYCVILGDVSEIQKDS